MDIQGKKQKCKIRTLLDTGAGTNFVAAEVLKYVKYEKITKEVLSIQGIHTVERRNYELVKLFLENNNCEIKEIICYVMEDLGKAGYLVDSNKMSEVMEECKGLDGLINPLNEMVVHKGDIGLVLTSGVIKDISIGPPIWYKDYTIDRTYFGPAVSGRIKKNKKEKNIDVRLTMIGKVEIEKVELRNDEIEYDKNNNSIDLNDIKLENGKVLENENGYEDLKDGLLVGMSLVNKELENESENEEKSIGNGNEYDRSNH